MINSQIELDFSLFCGPAKVVFGPVQRHRRQEFVMSPNKPYRLVISGHREVCLVEVREKRVTLGLSIERAPFGIYNFSGCVSGWTNGSKTSVTRREGASRTHVIGHTRCVTRVLSDLDQSDHHFRPALIHDEFLVVSHHHLGDSQE